MKSLVIFILIIVCGTAANAQPGKLLLYDNFADNYHQWLTNTSGDAIYTINSGKYVMENFDDKLRWSALHVKIDNYSDYTISCIATHNSGVTNTGYGLLFGGLDNDNYYVFDIAPTGYYRFYQKKSGTLNYLINWTTSSYVKKDNYTENTLKISKSGSTISFYVNGNWVNSYTSQTFFGDLVGFVKGGNQRIEFDNLEVYGTSSSSSNYTSTSSYNNSSSNDINFTDDFSDPDYDVWGEDQDGALEQKPWSMIDDDVLVLRSYKDSSVDRSIQFYLDTKATFNLSTNFSRLSGETDNATYGISIEDPDGKKAYAFYISANGYYAIKQIENGTTTGDWKTSDWINKGNKENKIEVRSDGSFWSMYVNGHYVTLISSKYIYHPIIFLIANNDQMVECDDFSLTGKTKK